MSHHNFCKNKLLSKGERCVGFNNVELKELISLVIITRDARTLENKWLALGSPGPKDEKRKNEGFLWRRRRLARWAHTS